MVFSWQGSYTRSMYEIGQHIDLSYLNDCRPAEATTADSGRQSWQFPVGTSFDFTQAPRTIIRIPVAFA